MHVDGVVLRMAELPQLRFRELGHLDEDRDFLVLMVRALATSSFLRGSSIS